MSPISHAGSFDRQQLLEQIRTLAPFIDTIADDDNLLELGLDSMHIMQLMNHYRARNHAVTFSQLIAAPTLADWQQLLS